MLWLSKGNNGTPIRGKKVVVTGGAKGIGEAIVRSFVKEGAIPIILGRNPIEAEDLLAELKIGHSYHLELTELNEIEKITKKILSDIGEIDILVNNAGVNDGISLNDEPLKFIESLNKIWFTLSHSLIILLRI